MAQRQTGPTALTIQTAMFFAATATMTSTTQRQTPIGGNTARGVAAGHAATTRPWTI